MNQEFVKTHKCMKEYLERVNKVLEYIENHYDSRLSLNLLANVAGFSPYHFHRIFHSIVGQTIQDYVKKIRIASAAYKLLYRPDLSITEIALDCGFSTHTDFARSFKSEYGMSASRFIREKNDKAIGNAASNRITSIPAPEDLNLSFPDEVKIIELKDYNIAYIRMTGLSKERNNPKMEKAFFQLFKWGKSHDYVGDDTIVLGITLDNPEFVPMEECRYDACITVPEGVCPDGRIGVRKLDSAGKYAACRFEKLGPIPNFKKGHS